MPSAKAGRAVKVICGRQEHLVTAHGVCLLHGWGSLSYRVSILAPCPVLLVKSAPS